MASGEQQRQLPTIAPGPGFSPVTRVLRKNKKSSSACLPCKQAKRKCSGRPAPCTACKNAESDCIFDETLDLRRKVAAKRTFGEMEYYRGLLYSLIESLRNSNEEGLHHILEAIRGSGDLYDISVAIETPPVDPSDSSSEYPVSMAIADENAPQEWFRVDRSSRITVEKLCDNPLFQVPSRPWTTVTDDNHLVSHLVSLYFTWEHPLLQVVDQTEFLSNMTTINTSSEFCSPVLVNSILAVASTHSDFPEVFTVPGDLGSRGQHFFGEAERLWRAEEGRLSLSNIQALILMSHYAKLQGKDNFSWLLLRQSVQLGQDFGMFKVPKSGHDQWDAMPENMKHASAKTAWAVFILNSHMSMESRKTADLAFPRSRLNIEDDSGRYILWTPYPRSNYIEYAQRPALLQYVIVKLADLTEILVGIQDLLFDKAFDITISEMWEEAVQLHTRLEIFLKGLPDTAIIDDEPVPHILFLYIRSYQSSVSLFGYFLAQRSSGELDLSQVERARIKQVSSAKEIARYFRLHREHYGLHQAPGIMLGAASISALTLITSLDDDSIDAFTELYQAMICFSGRFPAAKEALNRIDYIARDLKVALPFETGATLVHRGSECS